MSRHGCASRESGRTRQRHFDGISFEPRNLPEKTATPTTTVLALAERRGRVQVADCRPANAGSSTKRRALRGCVGWLWSRSISLGSRASAYHANSTNANLSYIRLDYAGVVALLGICRKPNQPTTVAARMITANNINGGKPPTAETPKRA